MRQLLQWPKTVPASVGWGTGLTALLIGVSTALSSDRRAYFPALGIGVGVSLIRLLWRWQRGPYRQEILERLSGPLLLYPFLLGGGLFLLGLGSWVIVITFVQAGAHPCICFPTQQGTDWVNLILGGGGGAAFEIVGLFGMFICMYRIIHWRRVPPG